MTVKLLSNSIYKDNVNERTDNLLPFGFKDRPEVSDLIIKAMLTRCKRKFIEEYWQSELHRLRSDHTGQKYPASIKGFPVSKKRGQISKEEIHSLVVDYLNRENTRNLTGVKFQKSVAFVLRGMGQGRLMIEGNKLYEITNLNRERGYGFFPFVKRDFTIPGMGEPGPHCCVVDQERIVEFTDTLKKVKTRRIICRRVECPECYRLWIKERAFQITLALEITSYLRKERPFGVVYSIPPSRIHRECWNWPQVNRQLFVRAYRRGKAHGIEGGFVFFHPFRVRKIIKTKLRQYRKTKRGKERRAYAGDVGFWRMIRKDVLDLGDIYKYTKVGPHIHGVCFGKPVKHEHKDFLVQVDYSKRAKKIRKLKETRDVVAKVLYLLTHCGITTNDLIIQPTRRYGCMYDSQVITDKESNTQVFILAKPQLPGYDHWYFENIWLPDKCKEIAELVDMAWSDERGLQLKEDGELDDDDVWLPIWKLMIMRSELENNMAIPEDTREFFFELLEYMEKFNRPPPVRNEYLALSTPFYWADGYQTGIIIPEFIDVVRANPGKEPEEIVNEVNPNQEYESVEQTIKERGLENDPKVKFWRLLNSPDPAIRLKALNLIKKHEKTSSSVAEDI